MSDLIPDPTLTPTQARSKLAVSHMGGEPDVGTKRLLRANLANANADKLIRQLPDGLLYPVHIQHLVELLLMKAGVDGTTVRLVGKLTRDAADAAADKDGEL